MKVNPANKAVTRAGFTLIEMIGVLAVIAILAAVLIPKVFEAINNARINNAAMSCQTAKTSLIDHYAKYGALAVDGSQNPPQVLTVPAQTANFDLVLLREQLADKPFATKIASSNEVDLITVPALGAAVAAADGSFSLSGAGTTNEISGSAVAVAIIHQVLVNDARDLSARIDGEQLSNIQGSTDQDLRGRVKYAAPTGGLTDVYVYLTHR